MLLVEEVWVQLPHLTAVLSSLVAAPVGEENRMDGIGNEEEREMQC